ncbi:MAG: hypothetical protein AB7E08_04825 [Candidatus Omnitrophota bacterium]
MFSYSLYTDLSTVFQGSKCNLSMGLPIHFILLLLASVGIALWNISAKKVNIHTDLHNIFVNREPKDWEKYLDYNHLHLQESYASAKSLLYQKALFTKISFILLILSALSLLLSKVGVL